MTLNLHPNSFFQQGDITDPTPYETDSRVAEGCECLLCEKEFHKGEEVIELRHCTLRHDRFLIHKDCLRFKPNGWEESEVLGILEELGFDWEEKEEAD